MAVVRIRKPVTAPAGSTRGQHPKVRIVAGSLVVEPDFASRTVDEAGLAPSYTEVDRAGRTPLLLRSGVPLGRLSFDVRFLRGNTRASVESSLSGLRKLAASGAPCTIGNYGPSAAGKWRLTGLDVTHEAKAHGTNNTTSATASLSFSRVSDPAVNVGPLSGGAKPSAGGRPAAAGKPAAGKPAAARTYTVKAGDTLSAIAQRLMGNAGKWKALADANGIRDPRKLPIGKVLRIP